ncbi:trk system potassium uptake protein TrkH [Modicisalibacter xianhensis]|uniref:Trk system potassium uptake protein TrkH n=1 Tax=Modicisalibacter xianhensis TaxID=442341 RepID=A0A4R8FZX6_9GAMM|nr:TrkH family potassium uptake protein [Halomonas xianhensis]TDX32753.1 trk system potassium uptake protein TrkH [Halomonas xianhensis]
MMRFRQRLAKPLKRVPYGRVIPLSPPQVILLGFIALITLGTLLLSSSAVTGMPMSWHEALFTATSAVTVTGLTVVDTSQMSALGQIVVLGLIQVGGLGFMTFAALMMALLGMRLPLHQQNMVRETLHNTSYSGVMSLVRLVILFTLTAELAGALLLALTWVPEFGWAQGLWISTFHAVSAFNNAGFTILPQGLVPWVADPLVNSVMSLLFVIGGLGFIVIAELVEWRRQRRLSLHARIVLHATLWLSLGAMLLLLLLEWNNPSTLGGLESIFARLQAAWFQAVTPRSAGFSTLNMDLLTAPATLLIMLLMFIGAGSGSTASGIKVSTFVVVLLVARSFLRGSTQPAIFRRAIPEETVFKAIAVALAGMLLVFSSLFVLTLTETGKTFIDLAFEAVSAFGTVGLSRGITEELSVPGQLTLCVTMLLGRVGPISLGYFITTRQAPGIRYAQGHVHIG